MKKIEELKDCKKVCCLIKAETIFQGSGQFRTFMHQSTKEECTAAEGNGQYDQQSPWISTRESKPAPWISMDKCEEGEKLSELVPSEFKMIMGPGSDFVADH